MTNVLSKASQISQEMKQQMMKEAIGSAFEELVAEPMRNPAKLPEHIFKNVFLPYFSGQKPIEGTDILAHWYSIAGSPLLEVAVIDDSGVTLFNVPPIQRTSIYNPMANSAKSGAKVEMSIGEISAFAERLSTTIPQRGANFQERAMEDKLEQITTVDEALNDDQKRWEDILARYKEKPPEASLKTSTLGLSQKPKTQEIPYDDLEF